MSDSDGGGRRPLQEVLRERWMSALGVLSNPEAQAFVEEIQRRIQQNRDQIERRVEEGVSGVTDRLRSPLAAEIGELRARVERVAERIEEQLRRRGGGE
jgi:polyhydroxyalkanoate synthesis regulator phasin